MLLSELLLIFTLVALTMSIACNVVWTINKNIKIRPSRVIANAIISPLIMIAFLTYFKFNFVRLDTVVSAVSGGILVGAFAVVLVNTAFPMLPSIFKLLVAKWLGIDEKKIQTPDETTKAQTGYDAPSPSYFDGEEDIDKDKRRPRRVKKE